jgi:HEAT repeat protein
MPEVGKLTEQLAGSPKVEDRRTAATELRDVGFARRRSLEKRGSISDAAESDLAEDELEVLHAALDDPDSAVRRLAILTVGDLGDASSVPALINHLDAVDQEMRLVAIDALGDIGGIEAVDALARLASDDDEFGDVRFAALTQLEELTAKHITSGPDRRFDPPQASAPASQWLDESEETQQANAGLARACAAIEADAGAEDFLRLKAADVRAYLESGSS